MPGSCHCSLQQHQTRVEPQRKLRLVARSSFNHGLVHTVVLTNYAAFAPGTPQYSFFVADMEQALDRSATPWVIVIWHAPVYVPDCACPYGHLHGCLNSVPCKMRMGPLQRVVQATTSVHALRSRRNADRGFFCQVLTRAPPLWRRYNTVATHYKENECFRQMCAFNSSLSLRPVTHKPISKEPLRLLVLSKRIILAVSKRYLLPTCPACRTQAPGRRDRHVNTVTSSFKWASAWAC